MLLVLVVGWMGLEGGFLLSFLISTFSLFGRFTSIFGGSTTCVCRQRGLETGWDTHTQRERARDWVGHTHTHRGLETGWDTHTQRGLETGWDTHTEG